MVTVLENIIENLPGEKALKNQKLNTAHLAVSERRLTKRLNSIEDDFQKSSEKLKKETNTVKKDLFELKKQKGLLCASTLHGLDCSPGIQDRYTRNKRFGTYDPALNKARNESPDKDRRKDSLSTWEKKKEQLIKNAEEKLQSIPISPLELLGEEVYDPYKKNLQRLLDTSKIAKDIRLTSQNVKSLSSICKTKNQAKSDDNLLRNRRASDIPVMRQRVLSLPTSSIPHSSSLEVLGYSRQHGPTKPLDGLDKNASFKGSKDSLHRGFRNDNETKSLAKGRTRKRSTSLTLPRLSELEIPVNALVRRTSDVPSKAKSNMESASMRGSPEY